MRKIIMYLLTITLLMPCLAQDKFATTKDCDTQEFTESFTVHLPGECGPDPEIRLTAIVKTTVKRCRDKNGRETTRMHVQAHGTAIGLLTRNEYVLNLQSHEVTEDSGACEFSVTRKFHRMLISKGPLPNLRVLHTSTLTVDSSCEPKFTQEFEEICKD